MRALEREGERKTLKRSSRKKQSHTIKTVRNESKSQEDDAELSNVDHKTKLGQTATKKNDDDELNLIFIQFQV
jgi:hypothetical protein